MKNLFVFMFLIAQHVILNGQNLPLLKTQGTHFVNAITEESVVLKGINVTNGSWGFWEWPLSDTLAAKGFDPLIRPVQMRDFVFTLTDVNHLRQLEGNLVRYNINYELFAESNAMREQNIAVLRKHIQWLDSVGIYTVLCLSMPPGLDDSNDKYERFKHADVRLKSVFESDSIFNLWKGMWHYIAGTLNDMDGLAGYELLNEPRKPALADINAQGLTDAYMDAINYIREADNRHIIFVCEFNSREANPGEQYWNDKQNKFVVDQGEQGVIWEQEWLQVPGENIAYVAHIYNPFEFTLGELSSTFSPDAFTNKLESAVETVYEHFNAPLFVSEYGVNYYNFLSGNDSKRIEWANLIHTLFEEQHVSSAYFQYKDLLNPWTSISGTLGIWQHFYDQTTISGVSDGKILYTDHQTELAAVDYGVDDAINTWFIKNNTFNPFSVMGNEDLIDELKRYFSRNSENSLGTKPKHDYGLNKEVVFPNPVENTLFIQNKMGEVQKTEVYNTIGHFRAFQKTSELDVSGFAPGMIYIKVYRDGTDPLILKVYKK